MWYPPFAKSAKSGAPTFNVASAETRGWGTRRTVATHAQHLGSPKDIATLMRHKQVETAQREYIQSLEVTVRDMGERLAGKLLG